MRVLLTHLIKMDKIVSNVTLHGIKLQSTNLTRTSRNQKGKAAQKGVTPQGGEKGEKQEAFPTAAFPDRNCSTVKRIWHLEI